MPTAAAMMTTFVTIRRRTSMPERNARIIDTTMITLPAAISEMSALRAPNSTGSTGTSAPAK